MELINDEYILRKVVYNINKNKSTKLKTTLEQLEQINKAIEKITGKKNKNIELFEDRILDKSELSTRIKVINDYVITYLMTNGLPKEQGNPSFLHLFGMNCVNLKIVIYYNTG